VEGVSTSTSTRQSINQSIKVEGSVGPSVDGRGGSSNRGMGIRFADEVIPTM